MNDKLKKVAQDKGLTKGMGLALSKLSGIDKSTVSAHLTGAKKLSMYHAEKYARGLEVPVIKLVDDKLVKYSVVAYCEDDGSVRPRNEEESEAIVSENHIQSTGEFAIYQKSTQIAYLYNPNNNCRTCKNGDICAIGQYSYVKTDKGNYIASVLSKPNKSKKAKILVRHTLKTINAKIIMCYPISGISFLRNTSMHVLDSVL